jgi:predicted ATPase/DNA-binding SARP family transcriptional activator
MANLAFELLGPLQISIDDKPVTTFESIKVSALLVYLVMESERPHRRETLVGLLWPDYPEESARHNLRQALSNLRRVLGDRESSSPFLIVTHDAIQFNRKSNYSLDVDQFHYYYSTCEDHKVKCDEDCSTHAEYLEKMIGLYRGDFLEHFYINDSSEFEEWILLKRESLRQRMLEAHSYLANFYQLREEYLLAQQHAKQQLDLDPWREEAHRQLMKSLAFDGQRSAALEQYEICKRILAQELDVEPGPEMRELYEQIKLGKLTSKPREVSAAPSIVNNNIPIQLTLFIGREMELVELNRQLADPECRCITLVGPGGIGKTRLAIEAAGGQINRFAHGAVFVPMAPISSILGVVPAIASAMNAIFFSTNDPEADLLNYLQGKQLLLVLDNVEHLLRETDSQADLTRLMVRILQNAPGVKLMVTTRQALNIQGEWLFEVNGLTYPVCLEDGSLHGFDAIDLFVQRVRRSSPGFDVNRENYSDIAHICRLVEGMPLAIELAATWVRVLSPAEIATEIEQSLDILSSPLRDLPERQRNMRVVFEYSWQMLSEEERGVLRKLSVFRGGFKRQAAEKVAGSTLTILSTLVSRTMVRRVAAGRYSLHELVRQYSAEQLATDPAEREAIHARHFEYYRDMAQNGEKELYGSNQLEWLSRLDEEHDNLKVAFEWALDKGNGEGSEDDRALQLAASLRWYWQIHGYFHEGIAWLTEALEKHSSSQSEARANALLGIGLLLNGLGELDKASGFTRESLLISRKQGNQRQLAEALLLEGTIRLWQGETSTSKAEFEEALSLFRKSGDKWGEALGCWRLGGYLADYYGDPAGRELLAQSATILSELGEKYLYSGVQITLGIVETSLGHFDAAQQHFEGSLGITREMRHPWGIADALTNLGCLFRIKGQYQDAQSAFEQALKIYQEIGRNYWEVDPFCAMAENAIAQGDLVSARQYLKTAAGFLGSSGNRWLESLVLYFQGLLAYHEGDIGRANALLEETMALARETQFKSELRRAMVTLGQIKISLGETEAANKLLLEGLAQFYKFGSELGSATALEGLAEVHMAEEANIPAVKLFATAQKMRKILGAPLPPVDRPSLDAFLASCRENLGEEQYEAAFSEGLARLPEEVILEILPTAERL